jgi:hypothetical protein
MDLARAWEHVRVERTECQRATPPSALGRVSACLHLGTLLPVDVEVELTIDGETHDGAPQVVTDRMWSAQSYQNGSYLFEAHVLDALLATTRHLTIAVRPTDRRHVARALVTVIPSAELHRAAPRAARRHGESTRPPVADDVVPVLPRSGDDLGP